MLVAFDSRLVSAELATGRGGLRAASGDDEIDGADRALLLGVEALDRYAAAQRERDDSDAGRRGGGESEAVSPAAWCCRGRRDHGISPIVEGAWENACGRPYVGASSEESPNFSNSTSV